MSKKASRTAAKAAKRPAPKPSAAANAAATAAPKKGVVRDGATVTRHYGDGTCSVQNFSSEATAKAYEASCKGAR